MPPDWPELSEELARKSLDVFERAAHHYLVEGDLSGHDLRIVIDTLTDTISGLVDHEVLNTIYDARKDLGL